MAGIDPTLYGGTALSNEFNLPSPAPTLPDVVATPPAPVPVSDLFQGTIEAREGEAIRAEASRERAGVLASIGAGFTLTDTANIISFLDAPSFEPTPGWNNGPQFEQLPMQLSTEEFEYLGKSKSQDEWDWRVRRVQTKREAARAAADNPVASFIPLLLDPVYLGADLLTAGAGTALRVGRLATAAAAAGATAGIISTAAQATPMSTGDAVSGILLNAAAAGMLYRGGKLQRADPDFPAEALQEAAQGLQGASVRGEVPTGAPRGATVLPEAAEGIVDAQIKTRAQQVGEKLEWNMAKTMRNYGAVGTRVSELLFDQQRSGVRHSVESHRRAIASDLIRDQRLYEDKLRDTLASQGAGLWQRIVNPKQSAQRMQEVQRQVQQEMFRREQLERQGLPIGFEGVPPHIKEMADHLDNLSVKALRELKAAGVDGAEDIVSRAGWHHRQWDVTRIEDMEAKFVRAGRTVEQAGNDVKRLVSVAIRRGNSIDDPDLAFRIASAVVDRAKRKGYGEDAPFRVHQGNDTLAEMRDALKAEGLSGPRLERALQILEGRSAEVGKPGFLKHRMDLDYRASAVVNGETVSVMDLIDSNLVSITDRYIDGVASAAAWGRLGYKNPNDLAKLRGELARDIKDSSTRMEALQLFDNAVAQLSGRPAGQAMNEKLRALSMYNRTIALAGSGLWQVTEYATILQRYGLVATTKYMMKTMPGFRRLWDEAASDPRTSSRLQDVLTRQSEQDVRLRPYLTRFADNFEMKPSSSMLLRLQQTEQLVPYVNAMKFVHGHQAKMAANLIVDRVVQAARGDQKALESLKKYGLEPHSMDRLARELSQHGTDTAKWSDETWGEVRPAFSKMMDEAVLHARLGDMPAWAVFDNVGKFLFTYRSFMLAAHNKVLAGSLQREGAAGLGLLLMYQFPLSMLAVQAESGIRGKLLTPEEAANRAVTVMGGLGAFSEAWGIVSGDRKQFGAPGLIPIDRLYGLAGDIAQGDVAGAASGALFMTPLLGILQPIRALEALAIED